MKHTQLTSISSISERTCKKEFFRNNQNWETSEQEIKLFSESVITSISLMQQHMSEIKDLEEVTKLVSTFVSRYVILRGSTEGLDKVLNWTGFLTGQDS